VNREQKADSSRERHFRTSLLNMMLDQAHAVNCRNYETAELATLTGAVFSLTLRFTLFKFPALLTPN
jgi:hypothetical protein